MDRGVVCLSTLWFAAPQARRRVLGGLAAGLQERPLWCQGPPHFGEGRGTRGVGAMSDAVRGLPTGEVVHHAKRRQGIRVEGGTEELRWVQHGICCVAPIAQGQEPFARSYLLTGSLDEAGAVVRSRHFTHPGQFRACQLVRRRHHHNATPPGRVASSLLRGGARYRRWNPERVPNLPRCARTSKLVLPQRDPPPQG